MPEASIRPANTSDIPTLIDLLDIASYGFLAHLFAKLSPPGSDVRHVIRSRMEDPSSQLSLRKTQVTEIDGRVAGFIMCEALPDPVDIIGPDTPALLRPLFELESLAPGTTLINFVATFPEARGLGIGKVLMERAEEDCGPNGMSLTIHDRNTAAREFYERLGYRAVDQRPIEKQGWEHPATNWVLMTKR